MLVLFKLIGEEANYDNRPAPG